MSSALTCAKSSSGIVATADRTAAYKFDLVAAFDAIKKVRARERFNRLAGSALSSHDGSPDVHCIQLCRINLCCSDIRALAVPGNDVAQ